MANDGQRKMALGDIKNAPNVLEKPSVKMIDAKTTPDESIEMEYAFSKYVDYFDVWTNKIAISDAEINRWVTMLNDARPDTPPPPPQSPPPIFEEEIPCMILLYFFLIISNTLENIRW